MNQEIKLEGLAPYVKGYIRRFELARKENDRESVLIHSSMLDELLKRLIEAYLIDHKEVFALTDGFIAPIGTLATRTVMAFGIGLISEVEYLELSLIRKIRNEFVGAIQPSFEDQSISTLCGLLKFAKQDFDGVRIDPREQFSTSAGALVLKLANRPHYAAQRRLSFSGWQS
jgi:mannitol operon repressor